MDTKIFVNLPVRNLTGSREFFESLGFSFNPQFSTEQAGCLVISDSIYFMLQTFDNFKQFVSKDIADPAKTVQSFFAISANSKGDVDTIYKRAIEAGGKKANDVKDFGFMYGKSFEDRDGYTWEVLWFDPSTAK